MEAEGFTDQLFELVEREAFDPEGVEKFLVAHPEYRAEFEQMKATLSLSADLPVEEPLASLDAAILELAEARAASTDSACEMRVALFEKRIASGSYEPSAQEQLDVGICYKKLGKTKDARRWLEGASADPATRDRAMEALEALP